MYRIMLLLLVVLTLFAALSGCGGDSTSTGGDAYVFPAGKSVITFSALSTARLAIPISAIDVSITLPPGMSVATSGGGSGSIDTASVRAGSALAGTNLAFGSYSASTRKVRLSMTTASNSYRSGEFLTLLCDVAPNTSISLVALRTLNTPVPVIKAVGYDSATRSTVVLTNKIAVTIEAAQ